MGFASRTQEQLNKLGITDESEVSSITESLETLSGAGDELSNATWAWLAGEEEREEAVAAARAIIADLVAAVDALDTNPAPVGRHRV